MVKHTNIIRKFLSPVHILLLLLFAVGSWFLYRQTFSSYFFQDDWFSFLISSAHSIKDIFMFFVPRGDVIYYRPLSMQIPFFLVRTIFGLTPVPFRIATFVTNIINGFLIVTMLQLFLKNKLFAWFGGFWYVTSAAHATIFYWAATFAFVLIPGMYLASFLLFSRRLLLFSWLLFIIGFFVNELIITLPVVLTLWVFFYSNKKRETIFATIPFWLGSVAYGLFRLTINRFTTNGGYQLIGNIRELLTTIRNFFLWSINWPEQVSNQFVKFFELNKLFLQNFAPYVAYFMTLTVVIIFFYFLVPGVALFQKRKDSSVFVDPIFGLLWFLITLAPVLIFKSHAFSYYVPIPLFGILLAGLSLVLNWQKTSAISTGKILVLLSITTGLWYITAYKTIYIDQYIHWAPQRAVISQELTSSMKEAYPNVPTGTIILVSELEENKWALGEESAFKVIYNDESIETFYGTKAMYFVAHPFSDPNLKSQTEAQMILLK